MAELEQGSGVEFVEMQDRPIAALLEENHLSVFMLVELPQVVLHDEFNRWWPPAFRSLRTGPLVLPPLCL